MRTIVPDASVLLAFYLPAEPYKQAALALLKAYTEGRIHFAVPPLTLYEVLNGLVRAVRGLRTGQSLSTEDATAILRAFLALGVDVAPVEGMEDEILRTAARHERSAYDAAYLVLARRNGWELVTGDDRFFHAVSGEFPFVWRVEDLASRI